MNITKISIFLILLLLLIYILVSYIRERGYYAWYPSQNLFFPRKSKEEVEIVKMGYSNRTSKDIESFNITDNNGIELYYNVLKKYNITREMISNIMLNKKVIKTILFYKYLYNRVRPYQLDKTIISPKNTNTYLTPSYPAGHVFQYYLTAKYYSSLYPEIRRQLYDLVQKVESDRVKAGIHYPSDGAYSRYLVEKLYDSFELNKIKNTHPI